MEKTIAIVSILTSILINTAQADYFIILPIEESRGGYLPNNSVEIRPPKPLVWKSISPVYTAWVDDGAVMGCSNWTPATNKRAEGETFVQTADDCLINQTRTRQNREQEVSSLTIRDVGDLITENESRITTSSRNNVGTGPDCKYHDRNYQAILRYDGYVIRYNNIEIGLASKELKSLTKDGYLYYVGDYVTKDDIPPVWYFYEVCRQPI